MNTVSRKYLERLGEPFGDSCTRLEGNRRVYGGGGGSGGGHTTSTTVNYSPEEAARRTQVMDEAERIYNSTGGQMRNSEYPGSAPVDFSRETEVAQQLAVQNAAAAQDQVRNINQGVNYGLTGAMDVQNNPYVGSAIQAAIRPIEQGYTDAGGVMSQIRTQAGQAGQMGSSRQGIAEGIAAGRMLQTQSDTAAKIASDAYNKGQETFQKTLTFAPQAMEAGMTPVNWLSSVGAQKESLEQAEQDYLANAAMWRLNAPWIPLQNYASLVYGGVAPSTTSSTTSGGMQRNVLGQAAGAGLTAASVYQMMNA